MKKLSNILSSVFFMITMLAATHAHADSSERRTTPCCCMEYGSFYTKSSDVIAPEHPILFDGELLSPSKGIDHPLESGEFILKEPGIYRITYSVSLKEDKYSFMKEKDQNRKVALSLNGQVIVGSEMFAGDQMSTMSMLVKVCGKTCCDYVLRLINNNPLSCGWHNIQLQSGPNCDTVSASIVIEKVCDCPTDCCCKRP
ncbi:MAG: hypothetical protein K2Y01_00810 [Rhabdochlamydiaceae bacterium]|nr:hypothetical protein [Rhabdochlamydiaceae bacterium]